MGDRSPLFDVNGVAVHGSVFADANSDLGWELEDWKRVRLLFCRHVGEGMRMIFWNEVVELKTVRKAFRGLRNPSKY